jgi:hypothetical protein
MTSNALMKLCSAVEMMTGTDMIVTPEFVLRAFSGEDILADSGVARGAGFGPLLLGLICWQRNDTTSRQTICAQLVYGFLTALYLAYLRLGGGFDSQLLLPASAVHAALAIAMAFLAYEKFTNKKTSSRSGVA